MTSPEVAGEGMEAAPSGPAVFVTEDSLSCLADLYRTFVGDPAGINVHHLGPREEATSRGRSLMDAAALLVVQDREWAEVPRVGRWGGRTVVTFPSMAAAWLWPFVVGGTNEQDGLSAFGDNCLHGLARRGMPLADIASAYLQIDPNGLIDLDAELESGLALQRVRDARCGFTLADAIGRRFRDEQLFAAPDQPTPLLLSLLVEQLMTRLGAPNETVMLAAYAARVMNTLQEELPIHPGVLAHFGLDYVTSGTTYRRADGSAETMQAWVRRRLRSGPHPAAGRQDGGVSERGDRALHARGLPRATAGMDLTFTIFDAELEQAEALINAGAPLQAQAVLLRIVEAEPRHHEAHARLAEVALHADGPSRALHHARIALSLRPNHARSSRIMSLAALRLDLHHDALLPALDALRHDPFDVDIRNVAAEVLEGVGERRRAIRIVAEGIRHGIHNGQTYSLLGNLHLRDGDLGDAEAAFATGVGLAPERDDLRTSLDQVRANRR